MTVGGAVTTPATYAEAQLGARPQRTFTVTRHLWQRTETLTDQGVSLEDLVDLVVGDALTVGGPWWR